MISIMHHRNSIRFLVSQRENIKSKCWWVSTRTTWCSSEDSLTTRKTTLVDFIHQEISFLKGWPDIFRRSRRPTASHLGRENQISTQRSSDISILWFLSPSSRMDLLRFQHSRMKCKVQKMRISGWVTSWRLIRWRYFSIERSKRWSTIRL